MTQFAEADTPCGKVRGIREGEVNVFKGIRYAEAARFEYPRVTKTFGYEPYDATKFGAACPQYRGYYDESVNNSFYHNEFRRDTVFTYGEDCLFLNIYAPVGAQNAPVILFIHGGNHTKGSADEKQFDGSEYAKRGVVFVTINYRLNVFGLFADKTFERENGCSGGFQFYDQLAAIKWINENVTAFGGNPQNVTLMGQSAGAMSVQPLILSPLIQGLVKGAIMLSGGGARIGPWKVRHVDKTYKYWQSVTRLAGCNDVAELKNVDAKTLFDAWNKSNPVRKLLCTLPYADGKLITHSLPRMQKKDTNNIPVIIGLTKNDMVPLILYLDAKRYARRQLKKGTDVYLSYFSENLPGDDKGAFHSCDLWYAFGTLEKSDRPFSEKDYKLSEKIIGYICNFAAAQNPNGDGLPKWEKAHGKKQFMNFNGNGVEACKPSVWKLFLNTVKNGGNKR